MLDAHITGHKLRALVGHTPQHSFPAPVDERDSWRFTMHLPPWAVRCALFQLAFSSLTLSTHFSGSFKWRDISHERNNAARLPKSHAFLRAELVELW